MAYWRWQFLLDSDGPRDEQIVTEHTFFQALFHGRELDIMRAPWTKYREAWRHSTEYASCHELASHVRAAAPPIHAIRYESARREGGACEVVFDVRTLSMPNPNLRQTWVCKTTRDRVLLTHDGDWLEFRRPDE